MIQTRTKYLECPTSFVWINALLINCLKSHASATRFSLPNLFCPYWQKAGDDNDSFYSHDNQVSLKGSPITFGLYVYSISFYFYFYDMNSWPHSHKTTIFLLHKNSPFTIGSHCQKEIQRPGFSLVVWLELRGNFGPRNLQVGL
jgi:hypothetical protein